MIDEEKCLEFYKQGMSKKKISKFFSVHERKIKAVLEKHGIVIRPQSFYQRGETHSCWKGGRTYVKGYVMIYSPQHPNKTKHNRVAEHRLMMEKKIGRFLTKDEVVDHINGVRDDNRIENLRLFSSNSGHLRVTLRGKIPKWTEEGKKRILIGIRKKRKTQPSPDVVGWSLFSRH